MRKILMISFLALLSVILQSQTILNSHSSHSLINTENVLSGAFQIEDICEDDIIKDNDSPSHYLLLAKQLSGTLSPSTVKITPGVWQPPE
jgi:hypothetical protein